MKNIFETSVETTPHKNRVSKKVILELYLEGNEPRII